MIISASDAKLVSIGNALGYTNGVLEVNPIAGQSRIARIGQLEFVTGSGTSWTGQGFRVDGPNRAFIHTYSSSNSTDNFAWQVASDIANSGTFNRASGTMNLFEFLGGSRTPAGSTANYSTLRVMSTINLGDGTNRHIGLHVDRSASAGSRDYWSMLAWGGTAVFSTTSTPTKQNSAILQVESTTQGFLPPRMTTAQRNAITSPALGLQLVSTTDSLPYMWNGAEYIGMYADGTGTDDQVIDTFFIASNTLYASLEDDGEPAKTVDLSPYLDNTDAQGFTGSDDGTNFVMDLSGTSDDITISEGQNIEMSRTGEQYTIAVDRVLADGTYTPTGVDSLNVSSTVKHPANYLRVGNSVTVSGLVFVTPTGAGNCYIELTVPVASNFATIYDAQGVYQDIDDHFGGGVRSIAASDAVRIQFTAPDNSEHPISYHYTYRIQ